MARPPLPLSTSGNVHYVVRPSGQVLARACHRDTDARRRLVSRTGPTRAAAERALTSAMVERAAPSGGGLLKPSSKVSELADAWLEAPNDWSEGTSRVYTSAGQAQVKTVLGHLRLQEVSPGIVIQALAGAGEENGHAAVEHDGVVAVLGEALETRPPAGPSVRRPAAPRSPSLPSSNR